jgi:hypothetical protein
MTPKANQYALAALKTRRAEMAGEIKSLKDKIIYRQEQLAHLDASILLLDPSFPVETIRPKRPRQVKLFKHGELGRMILDALRRANGKALSNQEIAKVIVDAEGYGDSALPALALRVRGNLTYQYRERRTVTKIGDRLTARWKLPS